MRGQLLGSALQFYEKRVTYLTGKSKDVGWDISKVALGLDRIASLQVLTGDRESAIRTRRRIVELYETNSSLTPPNAAAGALFALGELERLMGRADDAERDLREALKRFEELGYHLNVLAVEVSLGRLLFDMGKAEEARALLERARATQETDLAAGSMNSLHETYTTLANLHTAEGRPQEALSCYEKAKAMFEKDRNPRIPNWRGR